MKEKIRVMVWNEFIHEKQDETIKKIYPEGMHAAIAKHLNTQQDIIATCATLDQPEHGLTNEVLEKTDVLIWWGHCAHDKVNDEVVAKIHRRVLEGMGIICLHSAHLSKIFKALMGTSCVLNWRHGGKERLWTIEPSHPIAQGVESYFELPETEMYGERFDIPSPEKIIFISWYPGGEVFRSGCIWERGHGRIFYFAPGHELYPIYYNPNICKIITNAVRWAAPRIIMKQECKNTKPVEPAPL